MAKDKSTSTKTTPQEFNPLQIEEVERCIRQVHAIAWFMATGDTSEGKAEDAAAAIMDISRNALKLCRGGEVHHG